MSMQKPNQAERVMATAALIARRSRPPIEEEAALLELERYCSHGDTVHCAEPPKIFDREEGLEGDLEPEGERHRLVLDVGGYYKNFITPAPARAISYDEIGLALKLCDRLLHRVTRR
ncbi:MAG: hypothetical protein JO105_02665 [Hyphomicrobiales bacterium]|nr:hypothetical protein [Hyphomicrobiales bacterium]